MRLIHFSLSLLLISANTNAQQYLTFPIHKNFHFNWKEIEKQVPKTDFDNFIKGHPDDFVAYREHEKDKYGPNLDSLHNDLHFLDLNGDGINDVVFDGESDGEPREIEVFINHGGNYKNVFSVIQGIVQMDWQGGRLSRLFIRDWGCCDDYLEFHKIYSVNYDERNNPSFNQIYQSAVIFEAAVPDSIFETPLRFEVLNASYNIRSAPKKDDSSFQHWNNDGEKRRGNGNTIGKLVKGTRGMALGKTSDISGREWLYVEVDEEYLMVNDIIYSENKFPTKLKGWISSRYVKMLQGIRWEYAKSPSRQ
jgi:hypothetical protein